MIAALAWALLQSAVEPANAVAEGAHARWELARAQAEVGEPLALTLIVEHAPDARVELGLEALEVDTSWIADGPPSLQADTLATQTRYTWALASLEAGERTLPEVQLAVEAANGRKQAVAFAPTQVTFSAALGSGEDQPRPAREFRPVEPEQAQSRLPWVIAASAVLALAAALATWLLRRRRPQAAPPPSALERVEALATRDLDSPEVVRELHYELTALVRAEFDARASLARDWATDDEWLASVSPTLDETTAARLRAILSSSRDVKYGAAQPTAWAVRETLAEAREVLRAVLPANRSAA
ncbi:MAG: hypothetical protein IT454_06580 [Planctomycetes bacterium]|nr:hypothetical protein [Planctomycetota bacterium]